MPAVGKLIMSFHKGGLTAIVFLFFNQLQTIFHPFPYIRLFKITFLFKFVEMLFIVLYSWGIGIIWSKKYLLNSRVTDFSHIMLRVINTMHLYVFFFYKWSHISYKTLIYILAGKWKEIYLSNLVNPFHHDNFCRLLGMNQFLRFLLYLFLPTPVPNGSSPKWPYVNGIEVVPCPTLTSVFKFTVTGICPGGTVLVTLLKFLVVSNNEHHD